MRPIGLAVYKPNKAYHGFTLFAPMQGNDVYLIDMVGNFLNRWQLPYQVGDYGYLLENGNLLVSGRTNKGPLQIGGGSGIVMELDWESNRVWEYAEDTLHHDMCRMDNGNTMVLGWERVPSDLADTVKGGKPGETEHG